jgi:hypothetical protein
VFATSIHFHPSLIFGGKARSLPEWSLESVLQMKTKIVSSHTADSKLVKQEVNGTVILPLFSIPWLRPQSSGATTFTTTTLSITTLNIKGLFVTLGIKYIQH